MQSIKRANFVCAICKHMECEQYEAATREEIVYHIYCEHYQPR